MSTRYRALFDADVTFANGGGLHAYDFRLDIPTGDATPRAVGRLLVASLGLHLTESVTVSNPQVIEEEGPAHFASSRGEDTGLRGLVLTAS